MKPYFGKQVIERERHNSRERSLKMRQVGRIDEEGDYDGPSRVPMSMGAGHRYNKKIREKDFTDVLSPVARYLRGQIGQPWDKVYSELMKALGAGNWPMQHILYQHVLTRRGGFGDGPLRLYDRCGGRFYIDCGKVAFERHVSWHRPKPDSWAKVEIGEGRWFVEIKGIWYIGTFVEGECAMALRTVQHAARLRPAIEVYEPVWPDYKTGWGKDAKSFHFVKEKQANRKELKLLKSLAS